MKFRAAILLVCLLCVTACFASEKEETPKPAQSTAELAQQLEKILHDTHTPGVSVAIVSRNGPQWVVGLGKADVAATDRATTADTLFRIGSTSKAFASLSILKLANEGKLSLDDPVHKLAPEVWFENRWEPSDPVRVVDLLEHTTGWDDMHLREYAKDAPTMSLRGALDYDHHSRISRWRPGTRMAYCNSGPAVAAYIVEKITGQRFEDYVAQNFFIPIGMKTATYFEAPSPPLTKLYHSDGKRPYPYWNVIYRPAGSINASAKDMAAYLDGSRRDYLHTIDHAAIQIAENTFSKKFRPSTAISPQKAKPAHGILSGMLFQKMTREAGLLRVPLNGKAGSIAAQARRYSLISAGIPIDHD